MILDTRKTAILWSVIETHVASAAPVSSHIVVERSGVDASPATIRNDMAVLEEGGYLRQPHTSAGRVPTELAYRSYVEYLLQNRTNPVPRSARMVVALMEETEEDDMRSIGKMLARALAEVTAEAIVVGFARGDVYATGLAHLVVQPEFQDPTVLQAFSVAVDHLEETLDTLTERVGHGPTVLLGSQNPFGPQCGTVASAWELPEGHQMTLGIVGPMRMAYDRHLGLLRALDDVMRETV
ncbi:hypothetical protein HY632_02120 [Candidatus Uhrbacteria bacterium]|nr:hypothetical protein [Candidatus Uhrbacteria bacterium]